MTRWGVRPVIPYRALVLRPYRRLLATPGGRVFSTAGFVARMPIAMIGLGIVLLVVSRGGRYGTAGALSATFAVVNAFATPAVSRLVDRFGQRRILTPAIAVGATGVLIFVILVTVDAPLWSFYLSIAVAGSAWPSIGSLVRARWSHVLGTDPRVHTAYAYESVLDEATFVLGPLIVTLLATRVAPQAGLLTAVLLLSAGSVAMLAHRDSEPRPAPADGGTHPSALTSPGLPWLMLVLLFVGGVFGSVEISAVAFADEAGNRSTAGLLLACYAGGSMISGLLFGAVTWRVSARRRLLLGAAMMTATATTLPWIDSEPLLGAALFLAGVGIAPTLISAFSLVERIVPARNVTEGLTWATTGLVIGFSMSTWLAGQLVDGPGVTAAFSVASGSGLAAVVVATVAIRRLPR